MSLSFDMILQIIGMVTSVCSVFGALFAWYVKTMISSELGKLEGRIDAKLNELRVADVKSQSMHDDMVRINATVDTHEINNMRARHDISGQVQSNIIKLAIQEQRIISLEALYPAMSIKLDKLIDIALANKS